MLVSVPLFGLAVTAQLIIALLLVAGSTLQCAAPGAARLPTRLLTVTTRSPPSTIDHYLLHLSRRLVTPCTPPPSLRHRYNMPKKYEERFDPVGEPVPGEAGKLKSCKGSPAKIVYS